MRAVLQRVSRACVHVDGAETGAIGAGLLILLGVAAGDTAEDGVWLAGKIAGMRIFPDEQGRFARSVLDTLGGCLVVSQFTLLASTKKGTRPGFDRAELPGPAQVLYDGFCQQLAILLGKPVATGVFGAHMAVELVNDGPVTILLDSRQRE